LWDICGAYFKVVDEDALSLLVALARHRLSVMLTGISGGLSRCAGMQQVVLVGGASGGAWLT
jgi:hypothetical protein